MSAVAKKMKDRLRNTGKRTYFKMNFVCRAYSVPNFVLVYISYSTEQKIQIYYMNFNALCIFISELLVVHIYTELNKNSKILDELLKSCFYIYWPSKVLVIR